MNTASIYRIVYTIAFTNFVMPFMFSGAGVALPAMSRDLGMSGATIGLFETLYLGTVAALILPAGRLADAGDKKSFFLMGIAGFTLASFALGISQSFPLLVFSLVMHGIGFALFSSPNMTVIMSNAPSQPTAMTSAMSAQMRTLGMVSSMMLITVFLVFHLGPDGLKAETAVTGLLKTMRGALGLISILALLALLTAWRDGGSKNQETPPTP